MAGGVPGDGADSGGVSGGREGLGVGGQWTYVRVGAWASSSRVVVCLNFEGWEEGGEAVFGYWATRVGWSHCEGEEGERVWGNAKDLYSFTFFLRSNKKHSVDSQLRTCEV